MMCAALGACSQGKATTGQADSTAVPETPRVEFSADSAYAYVARQVAFGPRVPNTAAHKAAGQWLASELRRHGAGVTEQHARLRAYDGTELEALNILGRYNPTAQQRTLLVAHWDCRPWADQDPDPAKRKQPVDGANDGASGTGVLLEIARQLNRQAPAQGVDILFVDAEDWGAENNEESWALGARHFVSHMPEGYRPDQVILLDMVGGRGAVFSREYFSEQSAPALAERVWATAAALGHGRMFVNRMGSAVTDDHVQFIEAGIPAIDIIEYNPRNGGFNPTWHTTSDTMDNIDPATLAAVGETVLTVLRN